jgi:hypothetical protein
VLANDARCQPPEGGPAEKTQYFGAAQPSLRQLGVLFNVSEDAVVASVCPKYVGGPSNDPNQGYLPAMRALMLELSGHLRGPCSTHETDSEGQVSCQVVEVSPDVNTCSLRGRSQVTAAVSKSVLITLAATRHCDTDTSRACSDLTVCAVDQLRGEAMHRCQTEAAPSDSGFCYLDAEQQATHGLVSHCHELAPQRLRISGPQSPQSYLLYSCR